MTLREAIEERKQMLAMARHSHAADLMEIIRVAGWSHLTLTGDEAERIWLAYSSRRDAQWITVDHETIKEAIDEYIGDKASE